MTNVMGDRLWTRRHVDLCRSTSSACRTGDRLGPVVPAVDWTPHDPRLSRSHPRSRRRRVSPRRHR
ncbi:putative leader peptide [Rhodococcoides corynebacterioides]|uniref:putative leader peptide n=1 Tax=Rhodococcoides corynebacterioides TaxID=53972 RepID=UPI003530149A